MSTCIGQWATALIAAEVAAASAAEARAYLMGASRDGTFNRSHGTWRIAQANLEWLGTIKVLLEKVDSSGWIYREGNRNVWVVETTCPIGSFVRVGPPADRAFARGYFDAEGGLPARGDARSYIQMVQKDREDLSDVRGVLLRNGIECGELHNPSVRVDPDYWRFYVRSGSQGRFSQVISSWHPRKRSLLLGRFASPLAGPSIPAA